VAENEDQPYAGLGLEWLVAGAPEALLIVGPKGLIEHANVSAAHMFGYALDELVGASIEMLVPKRFRAGHVKKRMEFERAPYDRLLSGKLDISAVRRDGSEFLIDIELRPRRSPEGTMTIVVVREPDTTAPKVRAGGTKQAAAEDTEIWRLLARSRPLFAEIEARLAEILIAAKARHQDGSLPDDAFGEVQRLASAARSSAVELLRYADDSKKQHGR